LADHKTKFAFVLEKAKCTKKRPLLHFSQLLIAIVWNYAETLIGWHCPDLSSYLEKVNRHHYEIIFFAQKFN